MAVSYKKLWKLLIDRAMEKNLQTAADTSPGAISKLGRNENVTTAVKCDIGDIMEIILEEPKGGDGHIEADNYHTLKSGVGGSSRFPK